MPRVVVIELPDAVFERLAAFCAGTGQEWRGVVIDAIALHIDDYDLVEEQFSAAVDQTRDRPAAVDEHESQDLFPSDLFSERGAL